MILIKETLIKILKWRKLNAQIYFWKKQAAFFCFSGFSSSLLKFKKNSFWKKHKSLLSLRLESDHFPKYNTFFQNVFFNFSSSENSLVKCKKFFLKRCISWNVRKAFFWENVRKFLILGPDSTISQNVSKTFSRKNIIIFLTVDCF